jgi:predicted nucleotide-binding protein
MAKEPMVALKIPEPVFGAIANKFPKMWRCIAVELGNRLRQRNTLLRARNDRPVVFIGSSSEGLPEANAIEKGLPGLPDLDVQVWNMHTFRPSRATFKTLSDTAERCDFAIMVLRGDDLTVSRGSKSLSPRDNVIFELGLFASALGVERTFIVHRRKRRPSRSGGKPDLGIKLPSDLAGITTVTYNDGPATTLATRLASVCTAIKQEIDAQGVR